MKPLEYFAVAAQQVAQHWVHVLKIEGDFLGATVDRYLQVFDYSGVVAPDDGTVPLRQWKISQGSPFFQTFSAGELPLALGLFIAISDTNGTLTQSADTMDLRVELTDPEQPAGASQTKNVGTVPSVAAWANDGVARRLYGLYFANSTGTPGYVYIVRGVGDTNPFFIGKVAANTTKRFAFGQGLDPSQIGGDNVRRTGCLITVYEDLAHTIVLSSKGTLIADHS